MDFLGDFHLNFYEIGLVENLWNAVRRFAGSGWSETVHFHAAYPFLFLDVLTFLPSPTGIVYLQQSSGHSREKVCVTRLFT